MTVANLLAEHRRILNAVEGLETLVAGARPERIDGLSRKRWEFTRDLLLHFTHVEAWVHAPLLGDRRPEAVRAAKASRADTARLVADFRAHTARWHGFPPPAQWNEYGLVIDHMMGRIRDRLVRQEHDLYPLLPVHAASRDAAPAPAHPLSYAAAAWEIRKLIYREDGSPVEAQIEGIAPWSHFDGDDAAFGTVPA